MKKHTVEINTCDECKDTVQAVSECIICSKDICNGHKKTLTVCILNGSPTIKDTQVCCAEGLFDICLPCYNEGKATKKETFLKACLEAISEMPHALRVEEDYH